MFESLVNLFFPKACSGCSGFLSDNENTICTECRHEIPLTQHHRNPENDAARKFYGRIPVEHASALMYYHKKGIVQHLIHNLKYKGRQEIGTILGEWYAEDLKFLQELKTASLIVPVPLHRKRLKERGYNQVSTFGKALGERLWIPFNEEILVKKRYSGTQSKKTFQERTSIRNGTFEAVFDQSHYNAHFILIDDVLTTGTTLEHCARELLKIPGAKVSIVAMAMSHS